MNSIKEINNKTGFKKQLLNICFLVILIGITFYIILCSNKDFSFSSFFEFLGGLNPVYMSLAFVFLLAFIGLEGASLKAILTKLGYKMKFRQALIYSTSDIYYSAITPSATGGQPASVYYMNKDGIPVSVATASVTFNIFMYIASLMIIAIMAFAINAKLFFTFSTITKILIIFGVVIQFVMMVVFFMLMANYKILHSIAKWFYGIFHKLHLMKNIDEKLKKLDETMLSYKECIDLIKLNKSLAVTALLLNLFQRLSQIAIALCIYCAVGFESGSAVDVLVLQAYCLIGSNSVPLPGAVGVSEGLYLDAFKHTLSKSSLCNSMMATRGISYYISFILCGIITLVHHARISFKKKK